MTQSRVRIEMLPTGVPGLDEILGGGLPEFSLTLITGPPGSGKTTLSQQIMFANASVEHPALHFSTLGEPSLKILRHQQQFTFFDPARVGEEVRYFGLGQEEVIQRGMEGVLEAIVREVEQARPGIVVVDSFQTVLPERGRELDDPVRPCVLSQRLALQLASWGTTSVLVGQYPDHDLGWSPLFSIADGVVWLRRTTDGHSGLRSLEVVKMRGANPRPGRYRVELGRDGVRVHPHRPPARLRGRGPGRPAWEPRLKP